MLSITATGEVTFRFKHTENNVKEKEVLSNEEIGANITDFTLESLKEIFDNVELLKVDYNVEKKEEA